MDQYKYNIFLQDIYSVNTNIIPHNENLLPKTCACPKVGTISLFNDNYELVDQVACFDCLLDSGAKKFSKIIE